LDHSINRGSAHLGAVPKHPQLPSDGCLFTKFIDNTQQQKLQVSTTPQSGDGGTLRQCLTRCAYNTIQKITTTPGLPAHHLF